MGCSDPRCEWRCALWAAIGFMLGALFCLWISSASACDYTPDPVNVPPKIEVVAT